jgi:hypothetical protein
LFVQHAPPHRAPRYPSLPRFGFVARSEASRRCRTIAPSGLGSFRTFCSPSPSRPAELGLFGAFRPAGHQAAGEIGFVLHDWRGRVRAAGRRAGTPPQACPRSAIRNRRIGFVWHLSLYGVLAGSIGFVWRIRRSRRQPGLPQSALFRTSNFTLQTSNFLSIGFVSRSGASRRCRTNGRRPSLKCKV